MFYGYFLESVLCLFKGMDQKELEKLRHRMKMMMTLRKLTGYLEMKVDQNLMRLQEMYP